MLLLSVDTRKRDTWGCRGALRSLVIPRESPKIFERNNFKRKNDGKIASMSLRGGVVDAARPPRGEIFGASPFITATGASAK